MFVWQTPCPSNPASVPMGNFSWHRPERQTGTWARKAMTNKAQLLTHTVTCQGASSFCLFCASYGKFRDESVLWLLFSFV